MPNFAEAKRTYVEVSAVSFSFYIQTTVLNPLHDIPLVSRHEFHSFQVEANASSEVDALRSSIVGLRRQLASLSFRYREDTQALQKRLEEEERVNSSMRQML
jgi:hypothetical protein